MKNFGRTLRLVLRYPGTLVGSACCAILVAALWGANIGGMYPIVEIITGDGGGGRTLQAWIDKQIVDENATWTAIDKQIDSIQAMMTDASIDAAGQPEEQLASRPHEREHSKSILARRQWLSHYIHEYLPNNAFQTILLMVVVVIAGTMLKDVFLVLDAILVDRLTNLTAMELRKKFFRRTLRMELASFSDQRTAELTSRFTADMDSLHGGIQTLLGKAVREPLKMIVCFVGAGYVCWRLL